MAMDDLRRMMEERVGNLGGLGWDHNAIIEAGDLIEAEVREARGSSPTSSTPRTISDLRVRRPTGCVNDSPNQDKLDSRLNELADTLATAGLRNVSRVVAITRVAVAAELKAIQKWL